MVDIYGWSNRMGHIHPTYIRASYFKFLDLNDQGILGGLPDNHDHLRGDQPAAWSPCKLPMIHGNQSRFLLQVDLT